MPSKTHRVFGFISIFISILIGCQTQPQKSSTPTFTPNLPDYRPNIILILTDDLDTYAIPYMPLVEKYLTSHGTQMNNYFINVPQCCPSRATTLTGLYAHNSGVWTNGGLNHGGFRYFQKMGLEQKTVAVVLHNSGYRTGLMGKYLNGFPKTVRKLYIPEGWDEWVVPVVGDPYTNYNYKLNDNGEIKSYSDKPDDYLSDVLCKRAVEFIKNSSASGDPFFLYLAPYSPHEPTIPAPRHLSLFQDVKNPIVPSFDEEDVSDKPQFVRNSPRLTPEFYQKYDEVYRLRIRMLQSVDEMVKSIVNALEETGELNNTYIFFTSDNGIHMGQHRLKRGKLSAYEEDVRVPMIIRGPKVSMGYSVDQIVGNVDLAATFADIGKVEMPDESDGQSMLPLLDRNNPIENWRQVYLLERWPLNWNDDDASENQGDGILEPPDPNEKSDDTGKVIPIPAFKGIRTLNYAFIKYDNGEFELYDMINDPYQLDNLYYRADPLLINSLTELLDKMSACQGKECWITSLSTP